MRMLRRVVIVVVLSLFVLPMRSASAQEAFLPGADVCWTLWEGEVDGEPAGDYLCVDLDTGAWWLIQVGPA